MRNFLVVALLLTATLVPAQSYLSKNHGKDELRFTLILSRHGVRPPLSAAAMLNLHSADPWPAWEVPLGYLTPHGGEALRQMGAYMRQDLARNGLLPATGCPSSSEVYLYADTDERNIMSTYTTLSGLAPGCDPLPVNTIVPTAGVHDPLFSMSGSFKEPGKEMIAAERLDALGKDPAAFYSLAGNPELKEFASILAPDAAHPAAKPILDDPRPLSAASSMVEDILLEYVDGKPLPEVGWGRVDAPTLHRLMPLHTKQFTFSTRLPVTARTQGSNLMAHILDTLEQAAQQRQGKEAKPVPGALGPVGTHLVYISGHDSNLCYIGGLLGLHWTAEGLTDDTPPDSQIVFELWQNPKSKQYSVQVHYRAQTIEQLRTAEALSLANPPADVKLTPPGCHAGQSCTFSAFDYAAHTLLDPAYVKADLLPTHNAPPVR
ncbi:MAG: histidine-type phosphatase [Terracidiphilus sp.]|nr:histidine-type phosphatase [Terracidiphilus sp.]